MLVAGWDGGVYTLPESTSHPLLCALSGLDESASLRVVKTRNGSLDGGWGCEIHVLLNTLRIHYVGLQRVLVILDDTIYKRLQEQEGVVLVARGAIYAAQQHAHRYPLLCWYVVSKRLLMSPHRQAPSRIGSVFIVRGGEYSTLHIHSLLYIKQYIAGFAESLADSFRGGGGGGGVLLCCLS